MEERESDEMGGNSFINTLMGPVTVSSLWIVSIQALIIAFFKCSVMWTEGQAINKRAQPSGPSDQWVDWQA